MKRFLPNRILSIFLTAILLIVGVVIWQNYPLGVQRYKTIALGMQAAEKAGDSTGWAPPYDRVPEESEFFIYSLGDKGMCIQSDCGMGGYFIECLHGWISGYKDIGDVDDYGLRDAGVDIDNQKVITVANKDAKIVGIYPGERIRNLPYIMRNHRNLVPPDIFAGCSDSLPRRLK